MTVWQHVPFENEAAIGLWAQARNIPYRVIKTYENPSLEADEALVLLGGSMSAYDDLPFLHKELIFLQEYLDKGGKVFGICLGAQLLAKVLGAPVYSSGTREAGWRPIDLHDHPLTKGLMTPMEVFHWHGDTFDLPDTMVRLASNDAFPNQAFASKDGKILATQFHFETTHQSLEAILQADGDYLDHPSPYVMSASHIRASSDAIPALNTTLMTLLDRWYDC